MRRIVGATDANDATVVGEAMNTRMSWKLAPAGNIREGEVGRERWEQGAGPVHHIGAMSLLVPFRIDAASHHD